MPRTRARAALVVIALLALCSTGCDVRPFRVQIQDFEEAGVLGLWVWRATEAGDYERYAQIEFGEIGEDGANEYLPYSLTIAGVPVTFAALVDREPAAPDDVTLILSFGREPGTFKLSSYNAVGESSLSAGTLVQ